MKPREVPTEVYAFVEDDEDVVCIRGFPDYYITSERRILSTKTCTVNELSTFTVTVNKTKYDVIDLRKHNEQHRRSVDRLFTDHFDTYKAAPSHIEQYYVENDYFGSPEIKEWVENELSKHIDRRGSYDV